MIKERIPPSMIEGIVVKNHGMKNQLIGYLKEYDILDDSGAFNDIPIDKFVQVLS